MQLRIHPEVFEELVEEAELIKEIVAVSVSFIGHLGKTCS